MTQFLKALALGLMLASAAAPADEPLNEASSRIEINFDQQGLPVKGAFRAFSGHVDYDEADPASARATFELDPASLDLGALDYSTELRQPAWFDTADYPRARFVSSSVVPRPDGHLDAIGTLTIKGHARKVRIPLFAGPAVGGEIFDGSFEISRSDFGIGDPRWNGALGDRVRIHFHLFQPAHA